MLKISKKQGKCAKILFMGIFFYVLVFSYLSLQKYLNFDYHIYDLGIFSQVFFNTLRGDWFHLTINPNIYLADHFTPIMILLLPIYWIWQSPIWLLVLQSLVFGLSAWPLYLIAKQITNSSKLGMIVGLVWLLNPYVHSANLFEFHLMPLAVFFIFWTFYFYKKNNFVYFLLFFILSLLVREDIALVLLGFFVLSLVDKRKLKWKLTTLFLPIIYFVSALKIIDYFYQGGNYKFFIYYGWLGGDSLSTILWSWITHPIALLIHIFSLQNLGTAIIVLLPFLFLPLLRKKYLWLMLFPFLQLLMTASSLDFMVYSGHYILLFLPALFIALIFAIQKIKNKERFLGSDLIYKNKQAFFIISGFTVLYFLIFLSPVKSIVFADYNQERQNINQGFVSMIGEQDRIIAESTFVPQLSSRKDLHALSYSYFGVSQFAGFEFKAPEVEYILVDFSQAMSILTEKHQNQLLLEHKENMASNWREYLNDYNLIKASNNVLLWQNKKNNPNVENLDLFARQIKLDEFDSLDFLVENQYSDNHLKLTFQKTHAEEKEYLVRFYKEDYFYDVVLDYMMFPEKEWADNELISFYYYPDQQVESFQIFSWYGQNKFGKRKQLVVDIDVEPESDKINLSDIQ